MRRVGQQGTLTRIWAPLVMPNADTAAMNAHLAEISRVVADGAAYSKLEVPT